MDTRAWIAIVLGCVAVLSDLRSRVIPNWLTVAAIASALFYHALRHGFPGLGFAVGGTLVGFAVFLVFYLLGGMGGGDVKLMAAFGALLGPQGILIAALLAAVIGGLTAASSLLLNPKRRAIPYAPAIVLGSWVALLGIG